MVEELIECGLDGPAREKDVVDENNAGAVDVSGNLRGSELLGDGLPRDVVAMKRNIDGAVASAELLGEPAGEFDATVGNTQEKQFRWGGVAIGNGGSEPLNCCVNL